MSTKEVLSTKLAMIAGMISTPSIRDFTIEMMKVAPPSFRLARASKVHHPLDEREPGGNVLHTIRVVKLVKLLCDSCDFPRLQADIATSAAVIHDICRYGLDDEDEVTSKEHALLPRKLAEKHSITCEHAADILRVAENHMGKWGPLAYVPDLSLSSVLHIADAVSAHADEVWEQLGEGESGWVGQVPFSDQGMTQEMMTLMEEFAEGNEYWKSALGFVRSTSSRKVSTLTQKQKDWLENIIDTLRVELDRKAAEDVFNQ